MKVSTVPMYPRSLRGPLLAVLAIGVLSVLSPRAHATELDPITLSAPVTKAVGRDPATDAPLDKVTVVARIDADAETLTMDSGVKLLKDRVSEAAHKACNAANPLEPADLDCIADAVKAAQPQVAAAIAQARKTSLTR
jgi:UrcA family protein